VQTAQVKALACELPAERGVPPARWSAADLADEAVAAGVVKDISASTVARWLAADADHTLATSVVDLPPRSARSSSPARVSYEHPHTPSPTAAR
jgi:hypothetical protein